jgi:PAS domain S-box-containing protein
VATEKTDITDQKNRTTCFSDNILLLRSIIDNIQDGISVLDLDLNIVMANQRVKGMLPAGEMIEGRKCFQVYHQRDRACSACPALLVAQSGEKKTAQVEYTDRNNKQLIVEVSVFPLKNQDGIVTHLIEYTRDITKQSQQERARQVLSAQLESLWQITRLINEDYAVICQHVLQEMGIISESLYCFFGFLSEDEKNMKIHAWSPGVMNDCTIHNKPADFSIADAGVWANAIRQRRPFIMNDYGKSDSAKKGLPAGHIGLERIMAVPVFRDDKIVFLGVVANKKGDYTPANVDELAKFLINVRILLEKKQAEMTLIDQSNLLKIGSKLGHILTGTNSIRKMLQGSAELVNEHLDAAFTRIWLYNDTEKRLEMQASAGMYTHIDGEHRFIPLGQYKIGKIARDRTPHLTNSVLGDPLVHNQQWAKKERMVAFAGHPLLVGDKLVGVIALFSRHALSLDALITISSVADELAIGIERRLQEKELERSEAQYRRLVENLKERYFFYIHDTSGKFTYLSPSASQIFGYSVEKIMEYYATFLTDNPINQEVYKHTALTIQGKRQPPYEVEIRHRNGNIVNLEIMEAPIFSGSNVIAVEGIAHDISEKKKTEELLRRKNQALEILSRCRAVMRSADTEKIFLENICQIVVDSGGYSLAWIGLAENDKEKTVRKVSAKGLMGGYLSEIDISWGNNSHGIGPSGTAIREGRIVVCNDIPKDPMLKPWRERAAKYGYLSFVALPVTINDKTVGSLNIYSSRHDTFDSEEIGLLEELANDVALGISTFEEKKRREKVERELRHSQKMDAIGLLAGGIAHDFNNILVPILGFTEMVIDTLPPESQQKEDLDIVLQSAVRAKNLIQQILTFSRQDESELQPCMIIPFVKEALKFLRSSLPVNIEFKQNISNESIVVLTSATFIHQIVMNLCTNAFHAMEERGGTLTISLKKKLPDQICHDFVPRAEMYAELEVRDTGTGIDAGTMSKIFEPYFTTKVQGKGTGLGLSIVYGIVERLHGEIFFESKVEDGTKVTVYLPVVNEETESSAKVGEIVANGTERILIIDDEKYIADILARQLSRLGYNVSVLTDSLQALQLFEKEKDTIDMVITDQTMAHLSGVQLAEKILQLKRNIPIILMTGFSSMVDEKKAKEAGIKAFFFKPIDRNKLAETVRRLFDNKEEIL